jgi:cbb3-type cytochrome oxidase subunit 3
MKVMKLPRIKTKDTGESLKRLLFILADKAFLTFLGLFFVALILGAVIYYQYNILAKREEAQAIKGYLQFKEGTYQNISRIWQEREKNFKGADSKEYPNPFRVDQLKEAILEESSGSSGTEEETGLEEHFDSIETEQSEEGGPEELPGSSNIDRE